MGMVFCRGCGKEIHESAPTCPQCGAIQNLPSVETSPRNVAKLIGWSFVWTCVFFIAASMLMGFVAGFLDPKNGSEAGRRAGETFAGINFLISLCLSVGLTIFGKLPGTKKQAVTQQF